MKRNGAIGAWVAEARGPGFVAKYTGGAGRGAVASCYRMLPIQNPVKVAPLAVRGLPERFQSASSIWPLTCTVTLDSPPSMGMGAASAAIRATFMRA